MFKTFPIVLDITNHQLNDMFQVNNNDLNTIKLSMSIKSGLDIFDLTGKIVRIAIKKPDGFIAFQTGGVIDPANGLCEFILDRQAYLVEGKHEAEVMIYQDDYTVIVTERFYYKVNRAIANDKAIKSTDHLPAINQAIIAGEQLQGIDIPEFVEAANGAFETIENAEVQGTYAKTQGDYAKTEADKAAVRITELNGVDAVQLKDRQDQFEKKVAGTISILEFGAGVSKTATENTTAIQNAIGSMVRGDKLIIPPGDFEVNNLIFSPPDECEIICIGRLIGNSAGVTLRIGDASKASFRLKTHQLKVTRKTRDITAGNIGVEIINSYSGTIGIDRIYGYEKNLLIRGTNNNGSSYNNVLLRDLADGKKSLFLTADTGGWCNENNFFGGRFSFSSSIPDYTDHTHITVDRYDTHALNNNHFYSPSLESANIVAKAALVQGLFNSFEHPRMEVNAQATWTNGFEFTSASQNNELTTGYGVSKAAVLDNGTMNKIRASDGTYIGSSSATVPTMQLRNHYSSTAKVSSILDALGVERYYVKGSGELYSYQHGYFRTGVRWTSGDSTYNDRGLFNGTGSPEGVVTARQGSLYANNSGGAGETLYVKETGTGNTGWKPISINETEAYLKAPDGSRFKLTIGNDGALTTTKL